MESRSKAIWNALVSAFSFALMGVFVKLAADVAVLEKVGFRSIVSLILAGGFVAFAPKKDTPL